MIWEDFVIWLCAKIEGKNAEEEIDERLKICEEKKLKELRRR